MITNLPQSMARVSATALAACLVHGTAVAQVDPTRDDVLAIRARRIETVTDGVIENGVILIRNGKISLVGKTVKIPVGARTISADTVMPGIVAAYSQIGLSGPGAGPAIQLPANIPPQIAARFLGGGGGRAAANTHFRVLDELYPFEPSYIRLPRAGVTTLALVPEGRGFPGQGAVIKLAGEPGENVTSEKLALAQTSPLAIVFQQDTQTQELIRTTLQGGGGTGGGGGGGGQGRGGGAAAFEADIDPTTNPDGEEDLQGRRGGQFQRGGGGAPNAPTAFTLQARRLPVTRAVSGEIPTFITCSDSSSVTYVGSPGTELEFAL